MNNCSECKLKFDRPIDLNKHTREHHVEETSKSSIDKTVTKSKTETRDCNQCLKRKPLSEFYPSKYKCIACLKEKEECDICHKMILKMHIAHHKLRHEKEVSFNETAVSFNETKTHSMEDNLKTYRKCNKCNNRKEMNDFYASKYTCKECLRNLRYVRIDKEKQNEKEKLQIKQKIGELNKVKEKIKRKIKKLEDKLSNIDDF
jgi:hypothetical protein